MLTLAMAQLAGYDGRGHVKLAAVEFMHTATLLHDDVVDEERGDAPRPARRPQGLGQRGERRVGTSLLGQAFKMMVEVGSLRALGRSSSAAAIIAEGEVMQLAAAVRTPPPPRTSTCR